MRWAALLLLLVAPASASTKLPEGDPDIVVLYRKPQAWKRSAWVEVLRKYMKVAEDDKKAIRALSRQRFTARKGKVGREDTGFAFEVPSERALKPLLERLARPPDAAEVKTALKIWYWSDGRRRRVSDYMRVQLIATDFINFDTVGIWFPRRGAYFKRPPGMTVDAVREAMQSGHVLTTLGLTRPGITGEERLAEARKRGAAEARKRFGEFYKAYWRLQDSYEAKRRLGADWTPSFFFTVGVKKTEKNPRGERTFRVWTCGETWVTARENLRQYKLAEVLDWRWSEPLGSDSHGDFSLEALLSERGLLKPEHSVPVPE